MVVLAKTSNSKNCIKSTNKIPEYARGFKNEYLFVRGINKELGYFVEKYFNGENLILSSFYNYRIMFFMRKFIQAQELGYLKHTSCFKFKGIDVENIEFIHSIFSFDYEDGLFDEFPEYKETYEFICEFYYRIKFDVDESDYL